MNYEYYSVTLQINTNSSSYSYIIPTKPDIHINAAGYSYFQMPILKHLATYIFAWVYFIMVQHYSN